MGQLIQANETTTPPTPPSGYGSLFPKSDGHLYFQNAAGTVTQIDTNVNLNTVNVYTKNQSVNIFTLTDAATVTIDASQSNNFRIVLNVAGASRTFANPTNLTQGMIVNLIIQQDGSGNRTITWGSVFKFPGGTKPTLSTGANAIDMISAIYDSSSGSLLCNSAIGFA